jgi:ElaB/YqjD/DUF883 family membrane-anchored ribosome-binding protein
MAEESQHRARETNIGSAVAETVMDQIERAGAQAGRMVESVAEQAKEAGEKVQEVASTVDRAVRKSLGDQPMATLAVAAALGFVLGALWKSR